MFSEMTLAIPLSSFICCSGVKPAATKALLAAACVLPYSSILSTIYLAFRASSLATSFSFLAFYYGFELCSRLVSSSLNSKLLTFRLLSECLLLSCNRLRLSLIKSTDTFQLSDSFSKIGYAKDNTIEIKAIINPKKVIAISFNRFDRVMSISNNILLK